MNKKNITGSNESSKIGEVTRLRGVRKPEKSSQIHKEKRIIKGSHPQTNQI